MVKGDFSHSRGTGECEARGAAAGAGRPARVAGFGSCARNPVRTRLSCSSHRGAGRRRGGDLVPQCHEARKTKKGALARTRSLGLLD